MVHASSPHWYRLAPQMTLALSGGISVALAIGSARRVTQPLQSSISYLYRWPGIACSTQASHTPVSPTRCICQRPDHRDQSPRTATLRALGAHTRNTQPTSTIRAPRSSHSRRCRPALKEPKSLSSEAIAAERT